MQVIYSIYYKIFSEVNASSALAAAQAAQTAYRLYAISSGIVPMG